MSKDVRLKASSNLNRTLREEKTAIVKSAREANRKLQEMFDQKDTQFKVNTEH